MSIYDDNKFGVITRKWFGLTQKYGGDAANGFTFGTTDATSKTHVTRWYPKGPAKILKFGALWLASSATGSGELIKARLIGRGGSASLMASVDIKDTATTKPSNQFASIEANDTTNFTINQVKAGEYLSIKTATPKSQNGTDDNTATTTGTVAFFVDIKPSFDVDKWDADTKQYQA